MHITPLNAFEDNYIWVLSVSDSPWCILVDPGDATVVSSYLQQTGKKPLAILITHHHKDHTGGVAQLKQLWPNLRVIGPEAEQARIPWLTEAVSDNTLLHFPEINWQCRVIAVPGHTAGHIAFYSAPVLFCGDTLFSAGCGRLFEGTAVQMYQSLQRLAALPDETQIYCTHEYTLANLRFALTIEPDNSDLLNYQQQCMVRRLSEQPTLPTSIALEKKINPFLRCENTHLQQRYHQVSAQDLFTRLRMAKDNFKS